MWWWKLQNTLAFKFWGKLITLPRAQFWSHTTVLLICKGDQIWAQQELHLFMLGLNLILPHFLTQYLTCYFTEKVIVQGAMKLNCSLCAPIIPWWWVHYKRCIMTVQFYFSMLCYFSIRFIYINLPKVCCTLAPSAIHISANSFLII